MPTHGEVVMGRLHFATGYPWCCPEHGPIIPVVGGGGHRGRYLKLDRGIIHRWQHGPSFIVDPEFHVVWLDMQCDGHLVRVHYNSSQYFPIVPVSPSHSLADAFWHGDERYPVVEKLLRRLYGR